MSRYRNNVWCGSESVFSPFGEIKDKYDDIILMLPPTSFSTPLHSNCVSQILYTPVPSSLSPSVSVFLSLSLSLYLSLSSHSLCLSLSVSPSICLSLPISICISLWPPLTFFLFLFFVVFFYSFFLSSFLSLLLFFYYFFLYLFICSLFIQGASTPVEEEYVPQYVSVRSSHAVYLSDHVGDILAGASW